MKANITTRARAENVENIIVWAVIVMRWKTLVVSFVFSMDEGKFVSVRVNYKKPGNKR